MENVGVLYSSYQLALRGATRSRPVSRSPASDTGPVGGRSLAADPIARSAALRRRREIGGGAIFRVVQRLWIPLVVLAVICLGALTVSRLHGVFGSERRPSYADTNVGEGDPSDPTELKYEVFGAPGAEADISYFDIDGNPQLAHATLPWSTKFTATSAVMGSIVAQGDGNTLGCRILVDGAVKAEKVTHEPSAFTYCLLKPT